jgi:hypothetical protein
MREARERIHHIVLVKIERALPLVSPAYDLGLTERDQEFLVGALQLAPKPTCRRCQLIEIDCCSTLFLPDDRRERRHP